MATEEVEERLRQAYSVERLRAEGHALIDQLADYLAGALRREGLVTPGIEGEAMGGRWPAVFPDRPEGELTALVARILQDSVHQHDPRYVGYQITPPPPAAVLAGLVASLLNNGMASYEAGPAVTAMERSVIRWMADRVGFGPGADGVLTSGGSLGNLTALLAARQAKAAGVEGTELAILVGEETHYSVGRAAQVMGLGEQGVILVPVDEQFRMRADALSHALATAERLRRRVFAVVASAGSTSTGAFDPLDRVADFCAAHHLWMHVDGAHGASLALAPRHRSLLTGVERADSLVWDAHKMMAMPALATAVLFREAATGANVFSQQAHYLFSGHAMERPWDIGLRTVECTKRMMGLQLYAALTRLGTQFFDDYVTRTVATAQRFAETIAAAPDFELATPPQCNIVCFRFTAGEDALQDALRRRVHDSGAFFMTRTRLRGRTWLRVTIMNPFTTEADLAALLDALRRGTQGAGQP